MKVKNYLSWITMGTLILLSVNARSQCTVQGATSSLSFPSSGGSKTIFVSQTNPSGCTDYSITDQNGTFFTYSRSSGDVVIDCSINTTLFSRSGRLTVGGRVVQISQVAACAPQNPPGDITSENATICHFGTGRYQSTFVTGLASYVWSVSSGQIVEGQGFGTADIQFSGNAGPVTVSVAARNDCGNLSTVKTFQVNVIARPSTPTDLSYSQTLCSGSDRTFSVIPFQSGITYDWVIEGNGYELKSATPAASANVRIGSGAGTIKARTVNSYGCRSPEYFVEPVTSVGGEYTFFDVSGDHSICPGESSTIFLDGSTTSIPYKAYLGNDVAISDIPGAVIVRTGNSSSLSFGPFNRPGRYRIAAGDDTTCPIFMDGEVNLTVRPAIPAQPGAISKTLSTVCVNGASVFSVPQATPAPESYTWWTSGNSSISNQGAGENVSITFNSSGTQTVYVTANNSCGSSAEVSTTVNVNARPAPPQGFSHSPALCSGENRTFAVLPFQANFTYDWVVEGNGYELKSASPAASANVKIGSGAGTIKARSISSDGCKSLEFFSKPVSSEGAAQRYNVTGNGSICPGTSTTIHLDDSETTQGYTLYFDDLALEQKTGTSVSLTFGPYTPTEEGSYTIKSGSSEGSCLVVMNGAVDVVFKPAIPDHPGIISGTLSAVCNGATSPFSIGEVDRATSYTWGVAGGNVASQEGEEALIRLSTTAGYSTVSVTANNECGSGPASTKVVMVTHVSSPTFLPSHPNQCAGGKYTYRVDPVAGYNYEWEAPSSWEILGGQGTSSVQMQAGRYDGTIKVTAKKNGCGSQPASIFMNVLEPPGVFGFSSSRSAICLGESFMLNLSGSVSGYNYFLVSGESRIETKAGTNSPLTFGPYTTPGNFKVYSELPGGDCPYPMDGERAVELQTSSTAPVSIISSAYEICPNENAILRIYGGTLGKGAVWKWYAGSCSGTPIGTGSSISVRPSGNTTYFVRAEGICNTTTCATVSVTVVPACPDRSGLNYVRVRTPQKSGYTTLPVNPAVDDISTELRYADLLGRTSQTLSVQGSPSGKDLLSFQVYDQFGRESFQYQPVSVNTNWGMPVVSPVAKIADFYDINSTAHPTNVASSTEPFSETKFESSPLGRILKQGAPGEQWQPETDPAIDHSVKTAYNANVAGEVFRFLYDGNSGAISPDPAANHFGPGQLWKKTIKNEHDNEVIEYTDKEDRVVCRKVHYKTETNGTTLYASTYYLYDDYGNLVAVLPPEGVKKLLEIVSQN
jgi:hypothetical protein